jgi:hypothetical protein
MGRRFAGFATSNAAVAEPFPEEKREQPLTERSGMGSSRSVMTT